MSALSLPQKLSLRQSLSDSMKNLVFRKIKSVGCYEEDFLGKKYFYPIDGASACCNVSEGEEVSKPKNVDLRYSRYIFYTEMDILRANDKYRKQQIVGLKSGACSFDFVHGKFEKVNNISLPKRGDIVCGLVSPPLRDQSQSQNQYKNPIFTQWFVCSEQFLMLWTAITYNAHSSFEGKVGKNLKAFMIEKLSTNDHLRWVLAHKMNKTEIPREEDEAKFTLLRTELYSKKYVDVYIAVYLLALWGELPTLENIPQFGSEKLTGWSVRRSFIRDILSLSGLSPKFDPRDIATGYDLEKAWEYVCGMSRSDETYTPPKREKNTFPPQKVSQNQPRYQKRYYEEEKREPLSPSPQGTWAALVKQSPPVKQVSVVETKTFPDFDEIPESGEWGDYPDSGDESL